MTTEPREARSAGSAAWVQKSAERRLTGDHLVPVRLGDLRKACEWANADVVHEAVEAAELLNGRLDYAAAILNRATWPGAAT